MRPNLLGTHTKLKVWACCRYHYRLWCFFFSEVYYLEFCCSITLFTHCWIVKFVYITSRSTHIIAIDIDLKKIEYAQPNALFMETTTVSFLPKSWRYLIYCTYVWWMQDYAPFSYLIHCILCAGRYGLFVSTVGRTWIY